MSRARTRPPGKGKPWQAAGRQAPQPPARARGRSADRGWPLRGCQAPRPSRSAGRWPAQSGPRPSARGSRCWYVRRHHSGWSRCSWWLSLGYEYIIIYPGSDVKHFLGGVEPLEHRPSLRLAHLAVGAVNLQVLVETLEHARQPREVVNPRALTGSLVVLGADESLCQEARKVEGPVLLGVAGGVVLVEKVEQLGAKGGRKTGHAVCSLIVNILLSIPAPLSSTIPQNKNQTTGRSSPCVGFPLHWCRCCCWSPGRCSVPVPAPGSAPS
jgi:hypothetical protein